jgi:hypothetical protein
MKPSKTHVCLRFRALKHSVIQCADAVARWQLENGLLLNLSKSEVMVTGKHNQVLAVDQSSTLTMAGTQVPLSNCQRLLGITLDSHLTHNL